METEIFSVYEVVNNNLLLELFNMGRVLNYQEIFSLSENEKISIDFEEKVFDRNIDKNIDIAVFDFELKDRCFNNAMTNSNIDLNSNRIVKLHSFVSKSLWHTYKGKFMCATGMCERIDLLEHVKTNEPNLFIHLELSEGLQSRGFTLVSPSLISPTRMVKDVFVTHNGGFFKGSIENDENIVNLRFVLMN